MNAVGKKNEWSAVRGGTEQVHLVDYLTVLVRRKWIILSVFALIVCTVTAYSILAPPFYRGGARLLIENPSAPLAGVGQAKIEGFQARANYFNVIFNLLGSRRVAEAVSQRANEQLADLLAVRSRDGVGTKVKKIVMEVIFNREAEAASWVPYSADEHLERLSITPISDLGVIEIYVEGHVPELASELTNLHAEVFLEINREKKKREFQEQFEWLSKQVADQKAKVEQSYLELYKYQKEHGMILAEGTRELEKGKLVALNEALLKAQAEREAKEVEYRELQRISTDMQAGLFSPVIARDSTVLELRNKQRQLKEKRAELAVAYGSKHYKMIEMERKLANVASQLNKEVQRIVRIGREEVEQARLNEAVAMKAVSTQKMEAIKVQEKSFSHEMLSREAQSNQALYDNLLEQGKKANLATMFDGDNLYLADRALVPLSPSKPNVKLNILVACVLSLFVGTGAAFFVEYMDRKVRTSDDVARFLGLRVMGELPFEKNRDELMIHDPDSFSRRCEKKDPYTYGYLQALDQLPVELKLGMTGATSPVLQVASAATGEGKTTVLARLAVRLGKAGLRVLAADCDFQRPALHQLFSAPNSRGLADAMGTMAMVEVSNGSLSELNVSDLFTLIGLRKVSGKLTVINEGQLIVAKFHNGKLLNVEGAGRLHNDRIGTMLLNGGFLSKSQLDEAIERNKRAGQPFGYILISSGYVTQKQLQGHLKLQTEENLQKLFSWKSGKYSFTVENTRSYTDEKIYFDDDYNYLVEYQGQIAGSLLFEKEASALVSDTYYENVHFIAAGDARPLPGDPVNLPMLGKFISVLKRNYDVVLLDGPPILEAPDSTALCRFTDGCIFVIKSGKMSFNDLHLAISRIESSDTEVIAAVVNQVRT